MGFFDRLLKPFRNEKVEAVNEFLKTLTTYSPVFSTLGGGIYETELIRSAIHAKAKHTAKLTPHILGNAYKSLENVLRYQPNEMQSTYDFLYRLRTVYEVDTYAFILPILSDDLLTVKGLYPLKSEQVEIVEYSGETYLRYTFANGNKMAIEYDKVGVLSKHNYKHEFFGDGNGVLRSTTSLISLQNQGIQEAIKQSAKIQFMVQVGQNIRPEDLEKQRKEFVEQNLAYNDTSVMMFDSRFQKVEQINYNPYVPDEKQMELIKQNVYSYFGVNEDILQNKYDEDIWNAFYEGEVEPFAIQLSQAVTNMLFTNHEKAFGNAVHFSANRLQYASNKTKLEVSKAMFDRGIFGTDDVAEIWNLPITGENKKYIRKEYAEMFQLDDKVEQVEKENEDEGK